MKLENAKMKWAQWGNAVYDFSLNNKVLDNRAICGKKCSLSLRGCLYLCWKLLKKDIILQKMEGEKKQTKYDVIVD